MSIVKVNNSTLKIIENVQHDFLISNKEVALGYGIAISTLRGQKSNHKDELIENKHFIISKNDKKQKVIYWTKKGIIRLGFFIKSKEAREFRDWAEDYIVNPNSKATDELDELKKTVMAQNELIANNSQQSADGLERENDRLREEIKLLKHTFVFVHDSYHKILTTCSPIDMQDALLKMTNRFQLIGSTNKDGNNLNTQTIAKHKYWDS